MIRGRAVFMTHEVAIRFAASCEAIGFKVSIGDVHGVTPNGTSVIWWRPYNG